jgi:hypothetical protein
MSLLGTFYKNESVFDFIWTVFGFLIALKNDKTGIILFLIIIFSFIFTLYYSLKKKFLNFMNFCTNTSIFSSTKKFNKYIFNFFCIGFFLLGFLNTPIGFCMESQDALVTLTNTHSSKNISNFDLENFADNLKESFNVLSPWEY